MNDNVVAFPVAKTQQGRNASDVRQELDSRVTVLTYDVLDTIHDSDEELEIMLGALISAITAIVVEVPYMYQPVCDALKTEFVDVINNEETNDE